jgi:uncharacterized Zn finger protein
MSWYQDWDPYVPVAERRAKAAAYAAKLAKKQKRDPCPVKAVGRKMCNSFWGQAWCENLERYSDFSNRLPRGRTYARNGSVVDLQIERGKVKALVGGSDVYRISIAIKTLSRPAWKRIKQDCSQSIDSLLDLLQGRFDQGVMQRLTQSNGGLFPQPTEIEMECSCPDWAGLCKHLAAVMYCIGARLDAAPELLFTLRDVDHLDLIGQAVAAENLESALTAAQGSALAGSDLGEMFGIELDSSAASSAKAASATKPARRKRATVPAAPAEVAKKSRVKGIATQPDPANPREKQSAKAKRRANGVTPNSRAKAKVVGRQTVEAQAAG